MRSSTRSLLIEFKSGKPLKFSRELTLEQRKPACGHSELAIRSVKTWSEQKKMVEVEVNSETCDEQEPKMDTLALPQMDKSDSEVSEEEDGG